MVELLAKSLAGDPAEIGREIAGIVVEPAGQIGQGDGVVVVPHVLEQLPEGIVPQHGGAAHREMPLKSPLEQGEELGCAAVEQLGGEAVPGQQLPAQGQGAAPHRVHCAVVKAEELLLRVLQPQHVKQNPAVGQLAEKQPVKESGRIAQGQHPPILYPIPPPAAQQQKAAGCQGDGPLTAQTQPHALRGKEEQKMAAGVRARSFRGQVHAPSLHRPLRQSRQNWIPFSPLRHGPISSLLSGFTGYYYTVFSRPATRAPGVKSKNKTLLAQHVSIVDEIGM